MQWCAALLFGGGKRVEAGWGEVCSVEEAGGRREGLAEKIESCFQKP